MPVYLVGAGPGDPGLLTRRGAELLAAADVVVHDRLADRALLALAPDGAEHVDVGKGPGESGPAQDEINALLVERGRKGGTVVRLKGGDPFVLARGGEEAEALAAAGVPFEVVPGVTSAVAAPAYAGVPVTHRGLATSFTVVTGQTGGEGPDWEALARADGTLVVLMGVATRRAVAERLVAGGMDPATPVLAVRWGTRPDQRSVRTTLDALGATPVESPAVLVIGAVAGLDLRWFEDRPLLGQRVVVTRAREQAGPLVEGLRRLGAVPVEVPVVEVAEAADGGAALADAASRLASFDWVVLTSANGVDRLLAHLRDSRAFGACRVAAVGPATAAALARWHVVADLVPDEAVGEAVVDAFPPPPDDRAGRVLVAQAADARPVVAEGLRAAGWGVEAVDAYRTVAVRPAAGVVAAAAAAEAITFTASSTVRAYLDAAGPGAVPPVVVCIGPVTAATARDAGLPVRAVADPHTVDGLLTALVGALARPVP
ncbi:MAG TPA: uroporphyrinogen-III C-methyltransferase [Acidimicrobiales bacterium]|jgi:uroporphyrinogen III methyltransferase/synthase|nr:uroporphyrinogen-III C-methyltransferase [Acidimicrobiales bacterium]